MSLKHFYPLLFQKLATLGHFWEALGRAWCRSRHQGAMNVTKTSYECPVCYRRHPYKWSQDSYFVVPLDDQGNPIGPYRLMTSPKPPSPKIVWY